VIPRRAQIKAKDTTANGTDLSSTMLMKRTHEIVRNGCAEKQRPDHDQRQADTRTDRQPPRVELIEHRRPLPF
jgi:hypothetical protein